MVELRHNGFGRAFKNVERHQRSFLLSEDAFELRDQLSGKGEVTMNTSLYLSSTAEVQHTPEHTDRNVIFTLHDDVYTLSQSAMQSKHQQKQSEDSLSTSSCDVSKSYGDSTESTCIDYQKMVTLPYENSFKLELG